MNLDVDKGFLQRPHAPPTRDCTGELDILIRYVAEVWGCQVRLRGIANSEGRLRSNIRNGQGANPTYVGLAMQMREFLVFEKDAANPPAFIGEDLNRALYIPEGVIRA